MGVTAGAVDNHHMVLLVLPSALSTRASAGRADGGPSLHGRNGWEMLSGLGQLVSGPMLAALAVAVVLALLLYGEGDNGTTGDGERGVLEGLASDGP